MLRGQRYLWSWSMTRPFIWRALNSIASQICVRFLFFLNFTSNNDETLGKGAILAEFDVAELMNTEITAFLDMTLCSAQAVSVPQ
jgi:hypothetical protein